MILGENSKMHEIVLIQQNGELDRKDFTLQILALGGVSGCDFQGENLRERERTSPIVL